MKITAIESLHADAGWRVFSFLKIRTDEGITGWAEYNESYGSRGLSAVIAKLGERLIGRDPRPSEAIFAELYAVTRQAPGGVNAQAIAAIENALLDIRARALGVPVYALFGGPIRERLRLYWSHCGTYLLQHADKVGQPPLRSLADVTDLGRRVAESGYTALKTNILVFDEPPWLHMPGFARRGEPPELNAERHVIDALQKLIAAFQAGAGPGVEILLDLNFNFKTEGYLRVTRALDELGLLWFEIDSYEPRALAHIRRSLRTPVASLESLHGIRSFLPFFEQQAVDVAIVDEIWNGVAQSIKIAALAEAYEVNVAPHNFYGHLCTLHSAHFCAAIPNFRILEIDVDDVPWKNDLVTVPPRIEKGHLLLPTGPGWGADVNEEAVRAHPPKRMPV
ncbi:MAG TPA: mandelate racemase/muconate lactonizing enzyme family protein, partial [bacterium]